MDMRTGRVERERSGLAPMDRPSPTYRLLVYVSCHMYTVGVDGWTRKSAGYDMISLPPFPPTYPRPKQLRITVLALQQGLGHTTLLFRYISYQGVPGTWCSAYLYCCSTGTCYSDVHLVTAAVRRTDTLLLFVHIIRLKLVPWVTG